MSNKLSRAIEIATEAHRGQKDKAGNDYISHPLRVMAAGETEQEKIAGVLHDVVEDSNLTFDELATEGFDGEIIGALRCLTKLSDNEPYDLFIARVKRNRLAVTVKLNDLKDNMDITRLPYLSDKDVKRLRKYLKAYRQLSGLPAYSVEACRRDYPNAYNTWSREEDEHLKEMWYNGIDREKMCSTLKRKKGGIDSRLKKLGLTNKKDISHNGKKH